MKTHIAFLVLAVMILATPEGLRAQSISTASPDAYIPPPLPPSNWYELEFWQCDPLSCTEETVATSDTVSASATGPCYNGKSVSVSAEAFVLNCGTSYLIQADIFTQENSVLLKNPKYPYNIVSYRDDGLQAESMTSKDEGGVYVEVGSSYVVQYCNGYVYVSPPASAPC